MTADDLTAAFADDYARLAEWGRDLYAAAWRGRDRERLRRAEDEDVRESKARGRRYRAEMASQLRRVVVPACFGSSGGVGHWAYEGVYSAQAVADFLLGPDRVPMEDDEILAALISAEIAYEPPESDSQAREGDGVALDPLNPETWQHDLRRLLRMLEPPTGDDCAWWAAWMQTVWASMLVRMGYGE